MVDEFLFHGTRRRRRSAWYRVPRVTVLAGLVASAGLVALAGDVYSGGPNTVEQVHVHGGDSLWSIAERIYGPDNVRDRVDAIVTINHLDGGAIVPGQVLTVPAP